MTATSINHSTIVQSIKSNALGTGGMLLLQTVQVLVAARLVEVAAIGAMSLLTVLLNIIYYLVDWGILINGSRLEDANLGQLRYQYQLSWRNAILIAVVLAVGAPWWAMAIGLNNQTGVFYLCAVYPVIAVAGLPFHALMIRHMRFRALNWFDNFGWLVSLLIIAAGGWAGWGIWALLTGFLAKTLVHQVLCLYFAYPYWKNIPAAQPELRADTRLFGAYETGGQILSILVFNIDRVLIGRLLGNEVLGYYSMAQQFSSTSMSKINPILIRILMPLYARIKDQKAVFEQWFNRSQLLIGLVNTLFMAGLAGCSEPFVLLLAGDKWQPVIDMLPLLCLSTVSFGLAGSAVAAFRAVGKVDFLFFWNLAFLLWVSLVSAGMLYIWPGWYTAAWIPVVVTFSAWGPWYYALHRFTGIKMGQFHQNMVYCAGIGLLVFVAEKSIDLFHLNNLWWSLGIRAFVGGLVFTGSLLGLFRLGLLNDLLILFQPPQTAPDKSS